MRPRKAEKGRDRRQAKKFWVKVKTGGRKEEREVVKRRGGGAKNEKTGDEKMDEKSDLNKMEARSQKLQMRSNER